MYRKSKAVVSEFCKARFDEGLNFSPYFCARIFTDLFL